MQWPSLSTSDVPKTADGRPNLEGPTPRTADGKPDLSGIWEFRGRAGEWPVSKQLSDRVLSIPMGPHLDLDNAHRVIAVVLDAARD